MLARARDIPADLVFVDMEDAVAPAARGPAARRAAAEALAAGPWRAPTRGVRVNPVGSPWCLGDLREAVYAPGGPPDVVLVPKVEDAGQVAFVCHLLDALEAEAGIAAGAVGVELQIESARALCAVEAIAAGAPPRVEALVFGPGDFAASIGAPQLVVGGHTDAGGLDPGLAALARIVVAARAHGLQAVDGPWGAIDDPEGLVDAARRARALGCDGKWSIHPAQVPVLNREFGADAAERARARAILDALEAGGAARAGGEMVDEATRRLALAILRRGGDGDPPAR